MPSHRGPPIDRSERKALYVQAHTQPALRDCWTVNLSETGVGLVAHPTSSDEGPKEGEEVELSFLLPGQRSRVEVRGLVRWRHDGRGASAGVSAALGVQFLRFRGSDKVKLARYLSAHRVKAVVLGADWRAEKVLVAAVGPQLELLFAADPNEEREAVGRGDVSAVVVCGALGAKERGRLEGLLGTAGDARLPDLSPPWIYWGAAPAGQLVELFNTGRLFRALGPDAGAAELRAAIVGACQSHGMRVEQQRTALELERHLVRQGGSPHELASGEGPGFSSPAMRRVMELVHLVAPHRVAVLVQGETGTGKELVSRAIHGLSSRRDAAFVVQDCGALPETLLESELFGHVKGSFTGAISDHRGLFELADGGTILLDEIENTTANFQAKLLRVIETGEVRPVGGSQVRQVDVRLVAASNRPLEQEVAQGRFRSDLFYRLNSFVLDLPPLRERPEDLVELAWHFVAMFQQSLGKLTGGLSAEAEAVLRGFRWPGNVRELRNVIERAVLLTPAGKEISVGALPDRLVSTSDRMAPGAARSYAERLAEAERNILRDSLERNEGVLRRAALELGMDAVTLGRRAKKLGLRPA